MSAGAGLSESLLTGAGRAAQKSVEFLLNLQREQGYWWAELTADSTLESDYILLQLWLHPPLNGIWNPPTQPLIEKAVRSILARQLEDGGFNICPQGPADVSATIKAYFALKLAGLDSASTPLTRARECILAHGGIQSANSYVKLNLSLFNLFPREYAPSVPPEIVLLPGNFIYQMSSWSRAIVIPLSIVHSFDPRRPVPAGFDLQELFLPGVSLELARDADRFTWRNFFLQVDGWLKVWERKGPKSVRWRAVRKAEKWILERTQGTDGLAAIYPPMMYVIMALDLLGYGPDSPERRGAERQFNRLMVDDGERFFFQPCFSVVWDTAIACHALGEAQSPPEAALAKAAEWLLTKEVRRKGDWSVKRNKTNPSGWYFEFANEFYPDIDDTAMVLLALGKTKVKPPLRAINWLIAMQGRDGGWAAFDVDNDWTPLSRIPFADHNAMLDPSCPDITGRVVEALCAFGFDMDHPAVRNGVHYLLQTQESDGSWYGRWGVNYVYGTFLALRGLQAAGVSDREAPVQRGLEWVRAIQNYDGGWGESCASYDKNTFVAAGSTPSQTAWAILALLAGGDTTSTTLHDGIEYLVKTQKTEGDWDEDLATGTGFPKVFYLSYHLYRNSFPLLALNTYLKAQRPLLAAQDKSRNSPQKPPAASPFCASSSVAQRPLPATQDKSRNSPQKPPAASPFCASSSEAKG